LKNNTNVFKMTTITKATLVLEIQCKSLS